MAYDEGLAFRIRELVAEEFNIDEKKMFGGLAFMLNNYMFCGIIGDELMARVGLDNYEQALAQPNVREMDFTGRSMKGYVYVDSAEIEDDAELQKWLTLCADFVRTLPPKKPKKKK